MLGTEETLRAIDLANAPEFLVAMREMIDWAENRTVVVDCMGITYMDRSAFDALTAANGYAIERDHQLVIWGLTESCARVLRVWDPDQVLTIAS